MPKSKPWLKMWVESLDDPKMLNLTLAEEATWWRLLRLAQRCNADGSIITSGGTPLSFDQIIECLHITLPEDLKAFQSMLEKMEIEGSVCWNQETMKVVHFAERQELSASETPEAVRLRVRLFRQRHHVTTNTLQIPFPSPPDPRNPLIEKKDTKDIYIEEPRYVTDKNSLHQPQSNDKSVTSETTVPDPNVGPVTGKALQLTPKDGFSTTGTLPTSLFINPNLLRYHIFKRP